METVCLVLAMRDICVQQWTIAGRQTRKAMRVQATVSPSATRLGTLSCWALAAAPCKDMLQQHLLGGQPQCKQQATSWPQLCHRHDGANTLARLL